MQARISQLQRIAADACTVEERERMQRRMGKLTARTAIVKIGAPTELYDHPANRFRTTRAAVADTVVWCD